MVSSAMAASPQDAYRSLGVDPGATDQELRAAYRRLVQRHHPDHNGGSLESARRFEEIQRAYGQIREARSTPAGATGGGYGSASRAEATGRRSDAGTGRGDPDIDARMAAMEYELREAQRVREEQLRQARAARANAAEQARAAARDADPRAGERGRASDEELGYVSTDDSFTRILADARGELSDRFAGAREHPIVQRVSDLIDGLDELASSVDRRRPRRQRDE